MMILSLDTATKTGFAFGQTGCEAPTFGSRDFGGAGGNGEIVSKFRFWLNERCYQLRPGLVVFESPYIPAGGAAAAMNAKTLRRLLGITEQVCATCWEMRIECREATTLEIARFFVGTQSFPGSTSDERRAAKKAATIAMCHAWGWEVDDDNAADALALWALAEATVDPRAHSLRGGEGALFLRAANQAKTRNAPRRQPRSAQIQPKDEGSSSLWPMKTM